MQSLLSSKYRFKNFIPSFNLLTYSTGSKGGRKHHHAQAIVKKLKVHGSNALAICATPTHESNVKLVTCTNAKIIDTLKNPVTTTLNTCLYLFRNKNLLLINR
eukprot:TRINITY_DN3477_c0_g2_i1.p2 TRINITY_DN3477_c0_g2~~TRINITY_DN3477_c0_g2_i1.p2  ORF type:complete len:103 (-),score=10.71 TRINITY_DN3477_c0_g2_i1:414-722(-)